VEVYTSTDEKHPGIIDSNKIMNLVTEICFYD
jgi:hypothetical protein